MLDEVGTRQGAAVRSTRRPCRRRTRRREVARTPGTTSLRVSRAEPPPRPRARGARGGGGRTVATVGSPRPSKLRRVVALPGQASPCRSRPGWTSNRRPMRCIARSLRSRRVTSIAPGAPLRSRSSSQPGSSFPARAHRGSMTSDAASASFTSAHSRRTGAASLGIGGTERSAAVRAGRELTRLEPRTASRAGGCS